MEDDKQKLRRPNNSLHRNMQDVEYICRLGQLGARPNSICMVVPGDHWSDVKVGKVLKDYLGHGARHGRRPIVATVGANRREIKQRTFAYLIFELVSPWTECDAAAVIDSYEVYHFIASAFSEQPYPIERVIPFAQGAEKQGLRLVACKRCAVPSLVESYHVQSLFYCDTCADAPRQSKRVEAPEAQESRTSESVSASGPAPLA